ncbi:helix-turn-helix domain-containing protein [Paraurantiacibacter namhicola]|uniref:LuxR family regulatory protein n=1 Tax=Paraurantiacibacter namhicola TaxID=645517 RepID=A0A1C7D6F3_9SPHN|nr:DUF4019 domain-containing protein [Paraurantiacibacter namhicola]ANU06883.1 LuxR family regulatory protein [Paraurantiacibacter namhicola]
MGADIERLTEKERETLRLMLRCHDAKSMARELDLSVHTVNDRLKEARRKLGVTSSREAARLLLEHEGPPPELLGAKTFGDAPGNASSDPARMKRRLSRRTIIAGAIAMSIIFAIGLILTSQMPDDGAASQAATVEAEDARAEDAARRWLELGDAGSWDAAYQSAATFLREANTQDNFVRVSSQVRAPLGENLSRELVSVRFLNAPPEGFMEVTFRSQFSAKPDVMEVLTLQEEAGEWRVVGILLD